MDEKQKHELQIAQKHYRMLMELMKLIEAEAPQVLSYGAPGWALHRGRVTNRCTREADIAFSEQLARQQQTETRVAMQEITREPEVRS